MTHLPQMCHPCKRNTSHRIHPLGTPHQERTSLNQVTNAEGYVRASVCKHVSRGSPGVHK